MSRVGPPAAEGHSIGSTEFKPTAPVSPGTMLRAELETRGLSQVDLATRTGLSTKHINHVLRGAATLSPDVALILERTLGVPSSIWNSLESSYRDAQLRQRNEQDLAGQADWLKLFPLKGLISRGVLSTGAGVGTQVAQLLSFFGVSDVDAWSRTYEEPVAAFRRAQHLKGGATTAASTAVWLRLAELESNPLRADSTVAAFSSRAVRNKLKQLLVLTKDVDTKEALASIQAICATAGVLVVFVPKMPGTGVQGATRWLGETPLIALSDRYDWVDVFWFSLFHEIGHVLLHPRRATYVALERGKGDDVDGLEAEANQFAADLLIAPELVPHLTRLTTTAEIADFARRHAIDPSVVAGRYGRETNRWSVVTQLRRKVALASKTP